MLVPPAVSRVGDAVLVIPIWRLDAGVRMVAEMSCVFGATRRCPFGAAAGVEGANTCGRVEGRPRACTTRCGDTEAGVKVTVAEPPVPVRSWREPPSASTMSATPGSALPAAERTRTVTVAALPTVRLADAARSIR